MNRVIIFLVSIFLLLGGSGLAADDNETEARCLLTGNTYLFVDGDISYELSGFDCTFGPGCQSLCDLWYGDFVDGPKERIQLPFVCESGDVRLTVGHVEIACTLTAIGDLTCLTADVSGYRCIQLGEKTWCVPEDAQPFTFTLE